MRRLPARLLGLATATSLLLDLPFPIGGPLPAWRAAFAWIALVPLFIGLIHLPTRYQTQPRRWRLQWAFLSGWWSGALWFGLSDYWVYTTMHLYGGMNQAMAALCLVLFSLYLGVWFAIFALALAIIREATAGGPLRWLAPVSIPFLWVGMELAGARIPQFPWDQLGVSQVGNSLLTRLAPWTGVYGISFVLASGNAIYACVTISLARVSLKLKLSTPQLVIGVALCLAASLKMSFTHIPHEPAKPAATAILIQPNLSVDEDNNWNGPQWDLWIARWQSLIEHACKTSLSDMTAAGPSLHVTGDPMRIEPDCAAVQKALVIWPESPAPFRDLDDRFHAALNSLSQTNPLIVGDIGMTTDLDGKRIHYFNSATVVAQGGKPIGRYDKIHLVPFGEYVPFRQLFFFVKQLTDQLSDMGGGTGRQVFTIADALGQTHRYGIFICYESVFADEVREFAKNGAEVFVNISDDGWYGDSSAPWQHLNMARMRAIENRRWILRDTNTGVTSVIDPYGQVRQSIARHSVNSLAAHYGFNAEQTFYTQHGDLFAYACEILSLVLVVLSGRELLYPSRPKS